MKELNELKKERGLLSSSSPTFSQPNNLNTISHPQLDKSSSVASKKRKSDDISSAQASSRSSGQGIDRDIDNFAGSSSNFKRQEMEIKNKIELDTMNDLLKEFHQLLLLMTQTNTSTVSNNESTDSNEVSLTNDPPYLLILVENRWNVMMECLPPLSDLLTLTRLPHRPP